MDKVDIYKYTDYRKYLDDLFQYYKKTEKMSLRVFAHRAGFNAHAYLKQIIEGSKSISINSIWKIAKGFRLKEQERNYFEILVGFNQAKDIEEKNDYYKKLVKIKPKDKVAQFEKEHYSLFSKWYNLAILELVNLPEFKEDPVWISKNLMPGIKPSEAKEALDLLIKLNYLKRDNKGKLIQTKPELSTGPEVRSLFAMNYHSNLLKLADYSINHTDPLKRDVSALALVVDGNEFEFIKQRIQEFRREIIEYMRDRRSGVYLKEHTFKRSALYHLSIQLFNSSRLD